MCTKYYIEREMFTQSNGQGGGGGLLSCRFINTEFCTGNSFSTREITSYYFCKIKDGKEKDNLQTSTQKEAQCLPASFRNTLNYYSLLLN